MLQALDLPTNDADICHHYHREHSDTSSTDLVVIIDLAA
jgi:hypothetical protein